MDRSSYFLEKLQKGPLSAADFMSEALYHPKFGYYQQAESPWGFEGRDYFTALDLGPLLGQAVGNRFKTYWEDMGHPPAFTVLELGAGRGFLGRELLELSEEPFRSALKYLHWDRSETARNQAYLSLKASIETGQTVILDAIEKCPTFQGAILSNEFFDALPAQPFKKTENGWQEAILSKEGPSWRPARDPKAVTWMESQGKPFPGCQASWIPGLEAILQPALQVMTQGCFLAIDYGDELRQLFLQGSGLRRYRRHQTDHNWWLEPGLWDITADVDFTRLSHITEKYEYNNQTILCLSRWIQNTAPLNKWEEEWSRIQTSERLLRMQNLLQLTLPGMMGERFKVLEAKK